MHKSGFVNIIGRPNVGKSTLMNVLVGERMSIITNKPQTTRHRIIGILNDDDFQIVFSDTPGVIQNPAYKMQEYMNRYVNDSFEDADLVLFATDMDETYDDDLQVFRRLNNLQVPIFLLLNKIDKSTPEEVEAKLEEWKARLNVKAAFPISALNRTGTDELLAAIKDILPEGPAYYDKEQLTDRSERFFVSEIIREKILTNYHQEIPYSVQIEVESFKEDEVKPLVRIRALIYVERESQKNILIGQKGAAMKKVGIEARKDIEEFIQKQVFLELFVKIREDWRNDERRLRTFGY